MTMTVSSSAQSSTPPPHWWKASVGMVVMALLLSFYRVSVPLEQLSSSGGAAPRLLWRMDARTMELLTQRWQPVRIAYQLWHTAGMDALRDSHQALRSWTRLSYCTFYPLMRLAYWMLTQLFVLMLRLQPHFLRSLSRTGRAFWRWQWSRSPGQVLAQVLVLLWAVGVWVLHRRGVFIRAARRVRHGRDRLVQTYESGLASITRASQSAALMTPYVLYLWGILFVQLLAPQILSYIIMESPARAMLSFWFPILSSIRALLAPGIRGNGGNMNEENAAESTVSKKPKGTTKSKTNKVPSRGGESKQSIERMEEESSSVGNDCLQYWIISSSMILSHRALLAIPILGPWFFNSARVTWIIHHVQFYVYLSLYVIPHVLTPTTLEQLDQYRPLDEIYIDDYISPLVRTVHQNVSSFLSESTYQTYILEPGARVLTLVSYTGLVSEHSFATLHHLLQEGRALLLPSLFLFSPLGSSFCILYVAYILPLAQQCGVSHTTRSAAQWLPFWVVHTLVTAWLQSLASLLWWIPFSHVAVYSLYLWMVASPSATEYYYRVYIHQEWVLLQHWLSGKDPDLGPSAWHSVWQRLDRYIPKAAAAAETEDTAAASASS